MVRVAMLSFWHVHAKDYAKQADEHPDVEIVAVWDEEPARGRAEAEQRGVRFVGDLDELLAQPDVDGVIVDTPTNMHRDVMVAAAKAGKHIFTEKVLAATLREANEIVRAVEASGVKLVVSLRRLYNGYTQAIKEVIDQGLVGDVTMVRIRDAHDGAIPTAERPQGWLVAHFFDPKQAQGGAMIDLGCHPMYLARYFAGLPESVSAHYGHVTGRQVEDNAVAILRYTYGGLAIVETAFVSRFSPFSIEVAGTEGSLRYSAVDNKLLLRSSKFGDGGKQWTTVDVPGDRPLALHQWVSHIQQGTTATENIALAVDLTRLMEASNRSALSLAPVRLADLEGA